jgi:hypothetical protein
VRAGTYTGTVLTTGRSFVMVGEGSPVVEPPPAAAVTQRITMNGSQYQRVAIRGMTFHSREASQWALNVRTNYNNWPAPTVHLEDCQVLSLSPLADRVALLAESVGVTAQRCTMNTTQVRSCLATFVECDIAGLDQSWSGPLSQWAQTALDVNRSEVWIADSTLTAGDSNGVAGFGASCIGFNETSFTAASHVHVSGNTALQADQTPPASWPSFVFENYQTFWPVPSHVDYEASVVLVPPPMGLAFSAGITTTVGTVPHLVASAAPLGGSFACEAHSAPGDVVALIAGTTSRAHTVLGLPLIADSAAALIADVGVVGGTERHAFAPIPVPAQQSLLSIVLEASCLTLTPAGALVVSNPVSGILY